MKKIFLLTFVIISVLSKNTIAQGTQCSSASPFCTELGGTTYPAQQNTSAPVGPNYACLGSQPNPAWFYLQISTAGTIVLDLSNSAVVDIDFIIWGPFTSPSAGCAFGLTGTEVDCSYSSAANETCTIPNAIAGQIYVLLITNYSNQPTIISVAQTGGTGATNCNIECTISAITTVPSQCANPANTYDLSGTVTYFVPPTTGTLKISNSCSSAIQIINAPFNSSSANYTLTGLPPNGAICSVTAKFSADPTCTFTQNFTAPVANNPNVGPDKNICLGQNTTLSATGGGTYSWSPTTGLTSPNSATTVATPLVTTSYSVTVTSSNNCIKYDTVVVTVNDPIANAGPDKTICSGSSSNIGTAPITGQTYSWLPTTGLNNSGISNPILTPINNGTSTITATYIVSATLNGCIKKDTVLITIKPSPISNAGADVSFCSGGAATIGTAATAGYGYLWTPSAGLSDTSASNPTVTLTNSGSALITVTYSVTSTLNGCTTYDSVIVGVKPLPDIVAQDSWLCPGDSTILNASGGVVYAWSPSSSLNDSTLASPKASPAITTIYFLVGAGSNGCINSDTISVAVGDTVPVNAGNDRPICIGDSTVLGGTPTSPAGSTYFWTPPTGLNNVNIANPIAKPLVTITYIVYVFNDTCTGTDTVTVNVNYLPIAITGNDTSICFGQSTGIGGDSVVGNSYNWTSQPVGFNSILSNPIVSPATITTYYLTEVNTTTGCSQSDSIKITIMPLPAALTGNDTSICAGDSIFIGSDSVPGNSYSWTSQPSGFTSAFSKLKISPTDTTTYYLKETITLTGCFKNDSVKVSIRLVPSAPVAGSNSPVCEGDTIKFIADSLSGGTYSWAGAGGFVSSDQSPFISNVTPLNAGIYWVNVTVNACTSLNDSVSVIIHQRSEVNAGPDQLICIGTDSITLNGSSIGGNNGFLWSSLSNGSFFSYDSILNTTYVLSSADSIAGNVTLLLSSANNSACPQSVDTVVITIGDIPIVNAGNDQGICSDSSEVLLNGTVSGGSGTGGWSTSNGGGTFVSDSASDIHYIPSESDISNGTVTLVYTSVNSCINKSDTMVITISPLPTADFSVSNNNPFINQEISFTDESTNAFTWYWIFGAEPNTTNVQNPAYSFAQPGNYPVTLIVTSDKGCKDTLVKYFDIKPFPLVVPSGFTPNGDNVNDVLYVRGGPFKQLEFKIYNEWGNLIFVSNIQSDGWDGTYKGVIQPTGVFVYTVNGSTTDNESIKLSGEVNLIH